MIKVEAREKIRRAYYVEGKSQRQIARELHCSRHTIKKALKGAEPDKYTLKEPRPAPVLGLYKARIEALLKESERLPRKQRYTGHRIYELVWAEGYRGSEASVLGYVSRQRQAKRQVAVFLPLEFEPGEDAQVDWGEAEVILNGQQVTVQLFVLRLCYSRRIFVMAFPSQKQECFFAGHVAAFEHLGGVPKRLTYDNLKVAVQRVLVGRGRQQQTRFIVFRSHYLFESHFCTPGQGHEKGGVEHGVGYARRNFMTPLLRTESYDDLNEQLRQACLRDDQRRVARQPHTIYEAWRKEQPYLRPLPQPAYDCCRELHLPLNPYSQVVIETNRYSVPTERAAAKLRVKVYPFRVEIYRPEEPQPLAIHPRCYEREKDIFDPLHYLPLLAQRPGAFSYAKPIRQWRAAWPLVYERLLARLQAHQPSGQGVREFIRILQLHQQHPAGLVEQAVSLALGYGCVHADGVELCLRQLLQPETIPPALDLSHQPRLVKIGTQPLSLARYDQLLRGD
ncbi:MAG TPA: IS21 family transposase [Anaerolineae bacterium]|nr:IS21 family transposase [Anaerolineae bacterium]